MTYSEFLTAYANLPIDKRNTVLDFEKMGVRTMYNIYLKAERAEFQMAKNRDHLGELLAIAEEFLQKLRKE